MHGGMRILAAVGIAVALLAGPAEATGARVTVSSPWAKDDTVGDATRSQGDVERIRRLYESVG